MLDSSSGSGESSQILDGFDGLVQRAAVLVVGQTELVTDLVGVLHNRYLGLARSDIKQLGEFGQEAENFGLEVRAITLK